MIKVKNIKLIDGAITCDVKGETAVFTMKVFIANWDKVQISVGGDVYDACHVRNKLHRLYMEQEGNLPDSFSLYFG